MAYRTVVDEAGHEWTVWDTRPISASSGRLAVAPGYEGGWLTFECAAAGLPAEAVPRKRRMAPIPEHWAELTDTDLLRLMSAATNARSGL